MKIFEKLEKFKVQLPSADRSVLNKLYNSGFEIRFRLNSNIDRSNYLEVILVGNEFQDVQGQD